MRLAFDIETDGLLRQISTIHCIAAQDLDTNEKHFWDNGDIKQGLAFLLTADELWDTTSSGMTLKLSEKFTPTGRIWARLMTLSSSPDCSSQTFWTVTSGRDRQTCQQTYTAGIHWKRGDIVSTYTSRSLAKVLMGIGRYTPLRWVFIANKMSLSVARLLACLNPNLRYIEDCINTEHRIANIMAWQEKMGFPFDIDKAHRLESKLRTELDALSDEMRETFLFVDGGLFTPRRKNSTQGYHEGAAMCKLKQFSPTSRDHIAWAFETFRGWTAKERTASGRAKIDDAVLRDIGTDEALKFARILELQKHLGQLSDGKNAWLKLERKGRIHHSCVLATNTGRMVHLRPNAAAQIPSAHEYRELFLSR